MKGHKVPVQSLIDHIKTAVDVDPWAKEMAEELLKEQDDLGEELTNAVELIHKKNERIKELLKQQEHSETFIVIDSKTGKEADTYNIALYEDWAKDLCYCDMEGWAITDDGTLLLVDECGQFVYADRERFKVKWE